ncbi:MAG: tRNA 2-thiouridine(34) synthase MnmA [Deltaproteobacteria bacterium]|nr:MAG: tRNA 2-thiouridine(34) synthase MnmA [Deltaproteobacteria bacterium]
MRIGIAMSGGVDSTACALLLQEHYQIQGFFMRLAQPDYAVQLERVQKISAAIGIKLKTIDLRSEFRQRILEYFSTSYFQCLTPNPCVVCNREVKFGLLLQTILDQGMDKMATGHYARITQEKGSFSLKTGSDQKKDQSYFLCRLNQKQLAKTLFPLGTMTKEEIYSFVEERGFTHFRGQESQDVCFLGRGEINHFLDSQRSGPLADGDIIKTDGTILGRHRGLYRYTIGQRKGLGVAHPTPLYVIRFDPANNRLIVGDKSELFRDRIEVKELHWLRGAPDNDKEYTVRIRYNHKGAMARVTTGEAGAGTLVFQEAQSAVTPGQFAVIYDHSELVGSGIIV